MNAKKTNSSKDKDALDVIKRIEQEMNEEIDAVRVYQAIAFDKKNETHFSTRTAGNRKKVKIEFHNTLSAIKITSTTDSVIVPLTNVSAIYLKSPIKKEAIKSAEDEVKNLDSISKSQRDVTKRPI